MRARTDQCTRVISKEQYTYISASLFEINFMSYSTYEMIRMSNEVNNQYVHTISRDLTKRK